MRNYEVEPPLASYKPSFAWNFLLHGLEGGIYMGGLVYVDANTILPRMVDYLNGPLWLISLMPTIMGIGFAIPPIFNAHKIEQLTRVKPLILITGIFQRLPYLVVALILFLLAQMHTSLALVTVIAAPLLSGLAGGFSMTAWHELIAKTIPEKRRASLFALRYIIATGLGALGGGLIATILQRYPGTPGFARLYFIAFLYLGVSYLLFSFVRENTAPPRVVQGSVNLAQNLKQMLSFVSHDLQLQKYLGVRALMNAIFMISPFLTIYVLKKFNQPDSFMGYLITTQMLGGIAGNLLAAYLGNRFGGKSVLAISCTIFILIYLGTAVSPNAWAFLIIFFFFGAGLFIYQVGVTTLSLDLCPYEKRSTYLALMVLLNNFITPLFSLGGASLWKLTGNFSLLAFLAALILTIALIFLIKLQEPRSLYKSAT
jgi:MFS family permease